MIFLLGPFDERRTLRIQLLASENGFAHRRCGHAPPASGIVFDAQTAVRAIDQLIDPSTREVRSRYGHRRFVPSVPIRCPFIGFVCGQSQ